MFENSHNVFNTFQDFFLLVKMFFFGEEIFLEREFFHEYFFFLNHNISNRFVYLVVRELLLFSWPWN